VSAWGECWRTHPASGIGLFAFPVKWSLT
jgi:hypothetical protein